MKEHTAILDAMERGDAAGAADLMRQHINSLGTTYDTYLATLAADRSS
ncbi:MAG: FCD domain-containing protein [Tropicimonas sp.]